jgi:hypothetical protein
MPGKLFRGIAAMGRRRSLKKAVEQVKAAGMSVARIRFDADGGFEIVIGEPTPAAAQANGEGVGWDKAIEHAQKSGQG